MITNSSKVEKQGGQLGHLPPNQKIIRTLIHITCQSSWQSKNVSYTYVHMQHPVALNLEYMYSLKTYRKRMTDKNNIVMHSLIPRFLPRRMEREPGRFGHMPHDGCFTAHELDCRLQ